MAGTKRKWFVEPLLIIDGESLTPVGAKELLQRHQSNFVVFQQQAYLDVHKSLKALLVQHQDLLELTQYFMELDAKFSFDSIPNGC